MPRPREAATGSACGTSGALRPGDRALAARDRQRRLRRLDQVLEGRDARHGSREDAAQRVRPRPDELLETLANPYGLTGRAMLAQMKLMAKFE